ncbi:hypothetical protein B0T16DRAFT_462117 [Cercophora newfieldiana]|uniref:Uncharacterized protein n=1 Tax=Cercophora newfieldiana TaxID=92897 RepID=A0AA39XXH7_9PEZI|nr:hypothetical protein B0T16DRAFT_462117 [Cercophora newfieldiana]
MADYRLSVAHAKPALKRIFQYNIMDSLRFADLAQALGTSMCSFNCGQLGQCLFVLTVRRCCRKCLESREELAMVAVELKDSGDSPAATPSLKVTVGVVGRKEPDLFGARMAREIGVFRDMEYALSFTESHLSRRTIHHPLKNHLSMWIGPKSLVPPPLIPSCMTGDSTEARHFQQCLRFTAAVTLPYVDENVGKVDHGVSCRGCFRNWIQIGPSGFVADSTIRMAAGSLLRLQNKVYSIDGFLEHFRWCGEAQSLWADLQSRKLERAGQGDQETDSEESDY